MIHRSRHVATTLLAALAIPAAVVAAAPSAVAAPAAVDCSQSPTPNSHTAGEFLGTDVNIRTGPFRTCLSIGTGQPSNNLTVHCRRLNSNGVFWDFLTDHTTGKTGWSIDSLVAFGPTPTPCGPDN